MAEYEDYEGTGVPGRNIVVREQRLQEVASTEGSKVKISGGDTISGYLTDKINDSSDIGKILGLDGVTGEQNIQFVLSDTTVTDGSYTFTNLTVDRKGRITAASNGSLPSATETVAGIAEIATQAEVDAGTDDVRFVTPLKLKNSASKTTFDQVVSPAALIANTNDYSITGLSTANVIYMQTDGANYDLTGIVSTGLNNGQTYFLYNVGASGDIKLKNNNANSIAANRFITNGDVVIKIGMGVIITYDTTASRWRVNYFK